MTSRASAGFRVLLAAGFLAAMAIRILFLAGFRGNFDVGAYATVAGLVRSGGSPYQAGVPYNYSPVWAFLAAGLSSVSDALRVPFATLVGALLIAADAATAFLLYVLGGRGRRGAGAALLFFANPVSVLTSGHYLQFDNVAILFLVAAICAARSDPPRTWLASGCLSVSLLVKHIGVFFPPLFFLRGRERREIRAAATLIPYAVFAASFAPYWRSWRVLRAQVVEYRGGTEEYGVEMLRSIAGLPGWLPAAIFLGAVAGATLAFRTRALPSACLLLFLVMLIFAPGICEYYFVWPIALGSLYGGAGYFVYTLVVSGFYIGGALEGLGVPFAHLPGWHGVWWSLVLWLAWELRRRDILRSQ
jgi:Gpi18-like mannosyltransferase